MTRGVFPSPAQAGAQHRGAASAGGDPSDRWHRNWAPAFAGEADQTAGQADQIAEEGQEGGFTLVEVLVALLIFAILASAGVALLSFSVRAQAATGAKLDDLAALNRTLSILSADLAQASARETRDEAGTPVPAFIGEASGEAQPMLRLVRGGWTNLDRQPRPGVQKVAYRLDGGVLQRLAWPQLDGAAPLPPGPLLDRVRAVRLRYRFRGAWSDRWDGGGGVALPQALELRVQRTSGAEYRQLFLVGSGYAPPVTPNAPG